MRDYRIEDETDNGEFITTATAVLLQDGVEVHREKFVASSEDAPMGEPSAYYNGKSNHATTLALSYANGWVEAEGYSLGADEWTDEVDALAASLEVLRKAMTPRKPPTCDRCGRETATGLPTPCPDCTT